MQSYEKELTARQIIDLLTQLQNKATSKFSLKDYASDSCQRSQGQQPKGSVGRKNNELRGMKRRSCCVEAPRPISSTLLLREKGTTVCTESVGRAWWGGGGGWGAPFKGRKAGVRNGKSVCKYEK